MVCDPGVSVAVSRGSCAGGGDEAALLAVSSLIEEQGERVQSAPRGLALLTAATDNALSRRQVKNVGGVGRLGMFEHTYV